jgi:hypothetical protein
MFPGRPLGDLDPLLESAEYFVDTFRLVLRLSTVGLVFVGSAQARHTSSVTIRVARENPKRPRLADQSGHPDSSGGRSGCPKILPVRGAWDNRYRRTNGIRQLANQITTLYARTILGLNHHVTGDTAACEGRSMTEVASDANPTRRLPAKVACPDCGAYLRFDPRWQSGIDHSGQTVPALVCLNCNALFGRQGESAVIKLDPIDQARNDPAKARPNRHGVVGVRPPTG